jgi:hypothetical protein
MECIGVIRGIVKGRWIDLISRHPNLVRPPSREETNPFTNQPIILQPPADAARVMIDGREVGMMSGSEGEENEVNVFGESEAVTPVAWEIALALGARFETS